MGNGAQFLFSCHWTSQGGFEYKKAIVDTIITVIEENSEAKEAGNYAAFLPLSSKSCFVGFLRVVFDMYVSRRESS